MLLKTEFKQDTWDNSSVIIIEHYSTYDGFLEVSAEYSRKTFEVTEFKYRILRDVSDTLARWTGAPYDFVTEENLEIARNKIRKAIKRIPRILAKGRKHPAWKEMKQESKDYLTMFVEDFTFHDTKQLAEKNPSRFLWCLRETGTWLIYQNNSGFTSILDYSTKNQHHRFFRYDEHEKYPLLELDPQDLGKVWEFYNTLPHD